MDMALRSVAVLVGSKAMMRSASLVLHTLAARQTLPKHMALASALPAALFAAVRSIAVEPANTTVLRTKGTKSAGHVYGLSWRFATRAALVCAVFVCCQVFINADLNASHWLMLLTALALELAAEPCAVKLAAENRVNVRNTCDAVGRFVGALLTLALVRTCSAVTAFYAGILLHAAVYGALLAVAAPVPFRQTLAEARNASPAIVAEAQQRSTSALVQYGIARGDAWLLTFLAAPQDQGVHAVAANYGSLVCRIVLAPVEEAVFLDAARGRLETPALVLRLAMYTTLAAVIAGPAVSRPLVGILLGRQWIDAGLPRVLAAYGVQVGVMALSGCAEAVTRAVCTGAQWHSAVRVFSAISCGLMLAVAVPATRAHGSAGLIFACTLTFALRCAFSLYSVRTIFMPLRSVALPTLLVLCGTIHLYSDQTCANATTPQFIAAIVSVCAIVAYEIVHSCNHCKIA